MSILNNNCLSCIDPQNVCDGCTDNLGCVDTVDAKCVFYKGGPLSCTGITSNSTVETVIKALDAKICQSAGTGFGTYNMGCLSPANTITTQQQFVETISGFVCNFKSQYDAFQTSYILDKNNMLSIIAAANKPNVTSCSVVGIVNTDTTANAIQKLSNRLCDLYTERSSIANINWNKCFTLTGDAPNNYIDAFETILSQICLVKSSISNTTVSLPTFDNRNTCLPGPLTAIDTLESTVKKIRTKVCEVPSFDINSLTWGCITKPSNVATDLNGAVQAILTKVDQVSKSMPTFGPEFSVAYVDVNSPCLGKQITLANGIAGTDEKVKTSGGDATPGYLTQKIKGYKNVGITTSTYEDVSDHKLVIKADLDYEVITDNIDYQVLVNTVLELIRTNSSFKQLFCTIVSECGGTGSSCPIPNNLQVTFSPA